MMKIHHRETYTFSHWLEDKANRLVVYKQKRTHLQAAVCVT